MPLQTIDQPALPAWPKIPNPGEKSGLELETFYLTDLLDGSTRKSLFCNEGIEAREGLHFN